MRTVFAKFKKYKNNIQGTVEACVKAAEDKDRYFHAFSRVPLWLVSKNSKLLLNKLIWFFYIKGYHDNNLTALLKHPYVWLHPQ